MRQPPDGHKWQPGDTAIFVNTTKLGNHGKECFLQYPERPGYWMVYFEYPFRLGESEPVPTESLMLPD